jgi:nucleotide-binding universal stress UspA family protein
VRVIIATDGTSLSVGAAARALQVLQPADYTLATAYEPVEYDGTGFAGPTVSPEEFDELEQERRVEAETALTKTGAELGITGAEHALLPGEPGPALCQLAEELSADVIVIGTHHRSLLKRAVMGSVSEHVVHHAPCPVLVVGTEAAGEG